MKRSYFLKRFIPLLAIISLLLSGCAEQDFGVLDPEGPFAEDQLGLIILALVIMIVVLIVVFVIYTIVVVRFRRRKGDDTIPEQVEGNYKLELAWTIIPLILILILAVPTVAMTFNHTGKANVESADMVIEVTAHQFWWEFHYPDQGIYTAQEVVIPVNTKVRFDLKASDVLHSFWVPRLGGKMDTLVGQTNSMLLEADETGLYKGKCAELCGASHALMDFKLRAVSADEFNIWMEDLKTPAEVPADAQQGQEIFASQCMSCHAITPDSPGLGPNLAGFADRELVAGYRPNTEEWLRVWIDKPQEVKAGNNMPELPLTDQELDALVDYLQTLK